MKTIVALLVLVATASAMPVSPWQDPWQQQNLWQDPWKQQNPWQQNPWQVNPWQQQQNLWQPQVHHHHPEHHHVVQIPQQHSIPPPHPKPLKLKVHDESVRLHYDYPKIHHPHLVGFEHHVPEPQLKIVHKPVQHGWQSGWD